MFFAKVSTLLKLICSMVTPRVLNSNINTRSFFVEVDIGGVNLTVECSTAETARAIITKINKSLSTILLDKFVSYGILLPHSSVIHHNYADT